MMTKLDEGLVGPVVERVIGTRSKRVGSEQIADGGKGPWVSGQCCVRRVCDFQGCYDTELKSTAASSDKGKTYQGVDATVDKSGRKEEEWSKDMVLEIERTMGMVVKVKAAEI